MVDEGDGGAVSPVQDQVPDVDAAAFEHPFDRPAEGVVADLADKAGLDAELGQRAGDVGGAAADVFFKLRDGDPPAFGGFQPFRVGVYRDKIHEGFADAEDFIHVLSSFPFGIPDQWRRFSLSRERRENVSDCRKSIFWVLRTLRYQWQSCGQLRKYGK